MDKPLPIESLLPYPAGRASESLSSLQRDLREAQQDAENDSQNDEEASGDDANATDKPSRRPKRARACVAW
jgi:hypothetical protein